MTEATLAEDRKELRDKVKLVDDLVDWEYKAIDQRTGWVLVLQGFLINAFVTLLTRPEKVPVGQQKYLLLGIGTFAVLSAFALWAGITAGHDVIRPLKQQRKEFEDEARSRGIFVQTSGADLGSRSHRLGHLGTRLIPALAFVAWCILIVYVAETL